MRISLQRLGDDPRDYDGVFQGFGSEDIGGVNGVRPDAWESLKNARGPEGASSIGKTKAAQTRPDEPEVKHWSIYPPPPPPHWHWRPPTDSNDTGTSPFSVPHNVAPNHRTGTEGFDFKSCEIPGKHPWAYEIDDKGVFQIYNRSSSEGADEASKGKCYSNVANSDKTPRIELMVEIDPPKPLFEVPTIKDYYVDLDYVLGVVADGPNKSFAYRRIRYLQAKWGMYTLLHEHQELRDMKVGVLKTVGWM
jgi:AMP deaminase